jgi:hypothetical protein
LFIPLKLLVIPAAIGPFESARAAGGEPARPIPPQSSRLQQPGEPPPPVDGQLQLGKNPLAQETLEMPALAQDSIGARRGNLERVIALDRILDVEHLAHRVTHARAILDRDAARRLARREAALRAGVGRRPAARGPVDVHTQDSAPPLTRKLDVDQLIPGRLDRRLQQAHQGITHRCQDLRQPATKTKKGTIGPLFLQSTLAQK